MCVSFWRLQVFSSYFTKHVSEPCSFSPVGISLLWILVQWVWVPGLIVFVHSLPDSFSLPSFPFLLSSTHLFSISGIVCFQWFILLWLLLVVFFCFSGESFCSFLLSFESFFRHFMDFLSVGIYCWRINVFLWKYHTVFLACLFL